MTLRLPARLRSSVLLQGSVVVALVLAVGLPSLAFPFGRDQGEYAYIATAALRGQVIYRDVFNVKPPLTHIVHESALLLFGHSMLAIRLLDLLWQCATALVLTAIARRLTGRYAAGPLVAVLYALSYYCFGFWNTAQTDGFLNLPTAAAVFAFLLAQESDCGWKYAFSGAAIGVAVLFKYPIGLLLPCLAVLGAMSKTRSLRHVMSLVAGFCLPLTAAAAVLAAEGALGAFLRIQANYVPQYASRGGSVSAWPASWFRILTLPSWASLLIWPGAIAAIMLAVDAKRRGTLTQAGPVLLWWLCALVSYLSQGKGYLYHALSLLAPQAAIAAWLCLAAFGRAREPRLLRVFKFVLPEMLLLVPLVAFWTDGYPLRQVVAIVDAIAQRKPLSVVYDDPRLSASEQTGFSLQAEMAVANHIRTNSTTSDTVYVWGFEPTVYFLSGRACASRLFYDFTLYGTWAWPELREQLMADLERNQPLYIVVARDDQLPIVTGTSIGSDEALRAFEPLHDLVSSKYEQEAVYGNLTLYRRRG